MATPVIYDENQKFEIGKAVQIGEGIDATIIATGDVVCEAIKAKEVFIVLSSLCEFESFYLPAGFSLKLKMKSWQRELGATP